MSETHWVELPLFWLFISWQNPFVLTETGEDCMFFAPFCVRSESSESLVKRSLWASSLPPALNPGLLQSTQCRPNLERGAWSLSFTEISDIEKRNKISDCSGSFCAAVAYNVNCYLYILQGPKYPSLWVPLHQSLLCSKNRDLSCVIEFI